MQICHAFLPVPVPWNSATRTLSFLWGLPLTHGRVAAKMADQYLMGAYDARTLRMDTVIE